MNSITANRPDIVLDTFETAYYYPKQEQLTKKETHDDTVFSDTAFIPD